MDPSPTVTNDAPSSFASGSTTSVTWTATDQAGNSASSQQTVTVQTPSLLSQKNGIISSLQALSPTDKDDSHDLDEAIKKLTDSTDPKLWQSENDLNPKEGEKVFDSEKDSVHKLMDMIKHGKESSTFNNDIQNAIDGMVSVNRTIASQEIDKAGTIPGNDASHKVAEAQKEMDKASDEISKGHFDNAIDHYKNAWKQVQDVIKKNS